MEAGINLQPAHDDPSAERVGSAHAPYAFPGDKRLNIASPDNQLRNKSLEAIKNYINKATAAYPNLEKINIHAAPEHWAEPTRTSPPVRNVGEWDILVKSLEELGEFAGESGLAVCVENNRFYWEAIADDTPAAEIDTEEMQTYFCCEIAEWLTVRRCFSRQ